MKSSTKDRAKGAIHQAKGTLKEKTGRATDDPNLRDRGTAEKTGGKIQRKIGEVKKCLENKRDEQNAGQTQPRCASGTRTLRLASCAA